MRQKHLPQVILLVFVFGTFHRTHAQTYQQQERGILLYNLGSGLVIGGVGALINKKKGQDPWKVFLKGAGQGVMGGAINYSSKNITGMIASRENYLYGWAGRLTQSVGTSIIENAAANRNFWESYHFSYGPVRLEFDARSHYKPSVLVKPGALVGFVWLGTKGRFSAKYSLLSGAPVVLSDGPVRMFGSSFGGYAMGIVTAIDRSLIDDYALFAHEFIHIHQYEDFVGVNSFFDKPLNTFSQRSAAFNTFSKYVYLDLHAPLLLLTYRQLYNRAGSYYENWFEFEAEHFATQKLVPR
ncbi:MAG: hypothetical protein AAFR61_17070 [Bacteroidota bacterium]